MRVLHSFRVRLNRYKLVSKRVVRAQLLADPIVNDAIRLHCRDHGLSEPGARARVAEYIDEIVPTFNVLSYYRLGYNVARAFIGLFYRVSSGYQDQKALNAMPRDNVVLYLMNHRSNADYVVVAYVLARGVSISYAVGEWARVWPLEYVFKSFGAYFVRRGFREPLYHTVLERYVQLITRNGVTQGIFLEGGLSRSGELREPKVGLLDYSLRTTLDPEFTQDIWLVPVAVNYDRVLEDRTLIRELVNARERPGRIRQISTVLHYVSFNLLRLVTGNLKRYGRVAVNFGTPISVRQWCAENPGVLEAPRDRRAPKLRELAEEILNRIAAVMPVTPVPLVAAALLSFGETLVRRADLLARLDEYRNHLRTSGGNLVRDELTADAILDRAWRMLRMRRLVVREGDAYIVLPGQRQLLEYYANSVVHLLPVHRLEVTMHPALEPDDTLPRLRAR